MEEFGPQHEAEVLQDKKRLDKCDLLCFVFDSSDVNSFSYVVNLRVCIVFFLCSSLHKRLCAFFLWAQKKKKKKTKERSMLRCRRMVLHGCLCASFFLSCCADMITFLFARPCSLLNSETVPFGPHAERICSDEE